jgi:hypothetical protein
MANVRVLIPIIIIIIIAGALIISTTNEETSKNKIEEEWIKSGPFEIDKQEYNVGEKIFLSTINVQLEEKGVVQFFRPLNDTHYKSYIKVPFDGSQKSQFNYYFEPRYNAFGGVCSMNDIVGNWKIVFVGTQYQDINFKIINQTSSWDKRTFDPVC